MLAEILRRNRSVSPMVHCITNAVSANDCANLLLASGASPIMAETPEEVEEIVALCSGLVLNLGMPNPRKVDAMLKAGSAANRMNRPVVLDPVGVGSSSFRNDAARRILEGVQVCVIRGNVSEIEALADGSAGHRGVDDDGHISAEDAAAAARRLANRTGAVVVMTGRADIVTDGRTGYRVLNGCPMMRLVTGAGCQLSALTGAYAASNPEKILEASLAATCAMGLCGEQAQQRMTALDGNASCRGYIIDALCHLTPEKLERGARYEIF